MKLLHLILALELPFLIVALALSSWGLSFIIDQRDYKPGSLYPQYGAQTITYTTTSLSTSRSNATPVSTITGKTYTITRTLSPNDYGTAYYSSEYSMIGSIPPFNPNTKRAAIPTQAPTNIKRVELAQPAKRAYWANHSGDYNNVYGSLDGDPKSFVSAMVIPFALLVASLAARVLISTVYLTHSQFKQPTHKWNIALVTLTTLFLVVLWGSAISGLSLYASYYDDTLSDSVGLIVTIIFCIISCISSVIALVFMGMELHKSKKGKEYQYHNKTATRDSFVSETSSV